MKRSCCCILKVFFKTKVQAKGIEISQFTIIKTIGLPLVVVAVDVATDSNLLFDMNSYIDSLRTNSTSNSTDDNVTVTTTISTGRDELSGLFWASIVILLFSMLNLIFGNPAKTLIRNVRISVLMESREMEAKDVPLPIGEFFDKSLDKNVQFKNGQYYQMTMNCLYTWRIRYLLLMLV